MARKVSIEIRFEDYNGRRTRAQTEKLKHLCLLFSLGVRIDARHRYEDNKWTHVKALHEVWREPPKVKLFYTWYKNGWSFRQSPHE